LLGCITAVFFICWGPLVLYTILYEFTPEIFPQQTVLASVGYTLSLLFGMLTPIANPVFYGILNDPFQEVVRKRFPWLFVKRSWETILCWPRQQIQHSLPDAPGMDLQQLVIDDNIIEDFGGRTTNGEHNLAMENSPDELPNRSQARMNNNETDLVENKNKVLSETSV
jgi:hypothetical protein